MDGINSSAILGTVFLILIVIIYLMIRSRYQKYTSREYVLRYRNGQLLGKEMGGSYFLLPLIDQLIVLPRNVLRIDFIASQQIVFKPKFENDELDKKIDEIKITGFLTYIIVDPITFYEKSNSFTEGIVGSDIEDDLVVSTNKLLKDLVESQLKTKILEEPLDTLYRNQGRVKELIEEAINKYTEDLGIQFEEIRVSKFELI